MPSKVHATPTKEFFVRMITRDISLEDCILDLLDNCIDGAGKDLYKNGHLDPHNHGYEGYWAKICIDGCGFSIEDNCGGISVSEAIDYAFHFGRRPDAPSEGEFAIGLYGIGMKRAIFKLGNDINIHTSTTDEAFEVNINVEDWLQKPDDWDFDLDGAEKLASPGTKIEVKGLLKGVEQAFSDPVFINRLKQTIARDYSFFLQKTFSVSLNGSNVEAYPFMLRESADFEPMRHSYTDDETGVEIEIIAGMAGLPPDDSSPDSQDIDKVDYSGWFVSCNDRIVLAGDKTKETIWGDEFPIWHSQYNGFMGIVNFRSSDPRLLPWTTTKREIDLNDPLYRRAVTQMKKVTRAYIDYTNERKDRLEQAKALENSAQAKPILELKASESVRVPQLSSTPRVVIANIQYRVERDKALLVAKALGNQYMAYTQIGLKTFNYFLENEVEED